ncbi:uncharacterized protein C8Q71DRAFT_244942 [Rhodofomes roseus]|uniref:Secreted peptide n=1 Tax=Rhodofomes roseus TaxID=34475 RepID=A0ABQ8K6Y8_9APHY|nr:uncharacterized protein C8Q71DRAFT_244942 [Rhodofomes roseus]KAH9832938.1 hypothetical protein C8Q71DRAFT_244942 [Rhodofomes roseus]
MFWIIFFGLRVFGLVSLGLAWSVTLVSLRVPFARAVVTATPCSILRSVTVVTRPRILYCPFLCCCNDIVLCFYIAILRSTQNRWYGRRLPCSKHTQRM